MFNAIKVQFQLVLHFTHLCILQHFILRIKWISGLSFTNVQNFRFLEVKTEIFYTAYFISGQAIWRKLVSPIDLFTNLHSLYMKRASVLSLSLTVSPQCHHDVTISVTHPHYVIF